MKDQTKEEERKGFTVLYTRENIVVSIDSKTGILHCRWIGLQTEEALRSAGKRIHELFVQHSCKQVLNDNREVRGPWHHSAGWAGNEWFPLMIGSGLKQFAWICPEDYFSYVSARKAVSAEILAQEHVVRAFEDYEEGLDWLMSAQPVNA